MTLPQPSPATRTVILSILAGVLLVVLIRTTVPKDYRYFVLPVVIAWTALRSTPPRSTRRRVTLGVAVACAVGVALESAVILGLTLGVAMLASLIAWESRRAAARRAP